MIIHRDDDEISQMNITNLMDALSQRYCESGLPESYEVFVKVVSTNEKHYYFSPTVSDKAKDILASYNVFTISLPESPNDLRKVVL